MLIGDFLNFLLDEALEDARISYLMAPTTRMEFLGAEHALEDCRDCLHGDRMARDMEILLDDARATSHDAQISNSPDQAFWVAYEVQVEWIADVLSVILLQMHMQTIVPPTKGAAIAAARLVGVLSASD